MSFNDFWDKMLLKFGVFCRNLRDNNKNNIEKMKLFFVNTKDKFDEGFNKKDEVEYYDCTDDNDNTEPQVP
jgi:hypothetical protein